MVEPVSGANGGTTVGRQNSLTRRAAIGLAVAAARLLIAGDALFAPAFAKQQAKKPAKKNAPSKAQAAKGPAQHKPGQFQWTPNLSPQEGPVAIIISVPKQRVHVYRNGIPIGVSTASTGKDGYDTPTGVFTILQKEKEHYSSTYNDAPMPHMERLTWDGIALHAGKLPGYPASHGCVRLPPAFAEKVYGITEIGTPVIIAGDATHPATVVDPGLLLGATAKKELTKVAKKTKPVFAKTKGVTSILVSRADKSIYVIQNGDIVAEGKAEIDDPSKPLGSNVFVLQGGDAERLHLGGDRLQLGRQECRQARHLDGRAHQAGGERSGRDRQAHEARHGARHHRSASNQGNPLGQGLHHHGCRWEIS